MLPFASKNSFTFYTKIEKCTRVVSMVIKEDWAIVCP
jgi:hypothetical protein